MKHSRHRCARCKRKRIAPAMEFKNGFWICKPKRVWFSDKTNDCILVAGSQLYERLTTARNYLQDLVNGKVFNSVNIKMNDDLIPATLAGSIVLPAEQKRPAIGDGSGYRAKGQKKRPFRSKRQKVLAVSAAAVKKAMPAGRNSGSIKKKK